MTERYKVGDYLVVTKSDPSYFQRGDLVRVIHVYGGHRQDEYAAEAVCNPYKDASWHVKHDNVRPATPSEIQAATGLGMTDELSQAREHLRLAQEKLARLEAEQEKPWPQVGDMYWLANSPFPVQSRWEDDNADNTLQLFGLVAKTKQEAEQIYERQRIKQKVLARIAELNDGWEPYWPTLDQICFLFYDHHRGRFEVGRHVVGQNLPSSHYFQKVSCGESLIEEFTTEELKTALL